MPEDKFTTALKTVMQEGGFAFYTIYTPDPSDPSAVIEAVMLARSKEMMEAAALQMLSSKVDSVN
jgi:hypothetical protein